MPRRTDTRRRMLDTAADLFHTQGYHATGLNQLVSAGGAPKGSLYFHFPGGKEQLAAEALAASGQQLCEVLQTLLAMAPNAPAALDSVIDALARSLSESDFQRGCPLATVALEAASESEPIRQACDTGYNSWHSTIAEYLAGQGIDADRADNLSTIALALIEGGLLLAKTKHDLAPLRSVGEHLHTIIEGELT